MIVLSKTHLATHGIELVQKTNGDVIIESTRTNPEMVTDVGRVLEEYYPQVDVDILTGIAYNAIMKAALQQIIVVIPSTPSGNMRQAYDAETKPTKDDFTTKATR